MLDKYLDLFSKAFIVHEGTVRLNAEVQVTAAKHLQESWLLDGLINCLDLIFGEKQDLDGKLIMLILHSLF
jgi:hypothetical protein